MNDSTPLFAKLTRSCTLLLVGLMLMATSCNKNEPAKDSLNMRSGTVFVLNEGNYMSSNGTLLAYDPAKDEVISNDVIGFVNGIILGDSPSSMTIIGNEAFITLSGSRKIYVIDVHTGTHKATIANMYSPRQIEVISQQKAYVSNVGSPTINIIDPSTKKTTGSIDLGKGNFAEDFVRKGNFIYTNLWSFGNKILKIDATTDEIIDELEVGIQPVTLLEDANGKFWTLNDGGYEGNPIGYEDPSIMRIDPETLTVEMKLTFPKGSIMSSMVMSHDKSHIYFINNHIYKMSINDISIPTKPIVENTDGAMFYSMAVNPTNGELYVGNALDFTQAGVVIRYNSSGTKISSFKSGIIPGGFQFLR